MATTTATPLVVHHPRQSLRFTHTDVPQVEVRRGLEAWEPLADVVDVTRALTRQLAVDAPAARAWVHDIADACGQTVAAGDSVVTALVRLLYPLLNPMPPFPLATVPATIPAELRTTFRESDPRVAARQLFGDRATRPVVRAMCGLLACGAAAGTPTDMLILQLGQVLAPTFEPDHLAAFLAGTRNDVDGIDRAPLPAPQATRIAALLGTVAPRRRLALLAALHEANEDRERLRFIAGGTEALDAAGVRTWRDLTLQVVLARHRLDAPLGPEAVAPDTERALTRPPPPAAERYTLRSARTARDLMRLSGVLHNCLDTYAGRIGEHSRILEVLDRGDTAYAIHVRNGRVVEFRGDRNAVVPRPVRDDVLAVVEHEGHLEATRVAADAPPQPMREADITRWAARLLDGRGRDGPDWGDVGVLLWAHGVLHDLPDPRQAGAERAVEDACRLVRRGDVVPADHVIRTLDEVTGARRRLRQQATWRTHSGMRAQAMARMLGQVARRHPRRGVFVTDD